MRRTSQEPHKFIRLITGQKLNHSLYRRRKRLPVLFYNFWLE